MEKSLPRYTVYCKQLKDFSGNIACSLMTDYFIYSEQFLYITNFQKLVTTGTSPIYNFKLKPYLPFHQWKSCLEGICSIRTLERTRENTTRGNNLCPRAFMRNALHLWDFMK